MHQKVRHVLDLRQQGRFLFSWDRITFNDSFDLINVLVAVLENIRVAAAPCLQVHMKYTCNCGYGNCLSMNTTPTVAVANATNV